MSQSVLDHSTCPELISSSSPASQWTTGPVVFYCSRSARRAPARRWRSPGTWQTQPRSRRWSGKLCHAGTTAVPWGTSPCSHRWAATRRRARRWSWRSPGSWCGCGAVPGRRRLLGQCSGGKGTPTGKERQWACGKPGQTDSQSPEREGNTVRTGLASPVWTWNRLYLSCDQDPDQNMHNVEFTDFWFQGNASNKMKGDYI